MKQERAESSSLRTRLRQFCLLMHGLDLQDLHVLFNLKSFESSVRIFDPSSRSMLPIGDLQLEWPIVWLLVRHHKRHVFSKRKTVDLSAVLEQVVQFERKVLWSWHHRHCAVKPDFVVKRFSTPPYVGGFAPLPLRYWLRRVRDTVLHAYRHGKACVSRHCAVNWHALHRCAVQLMHEKGLVVAPLDKEPGVCLVKKTVLMQVHAGILQRASYEELSDDGSSRVPALRREFFALAKRVAALYPSELGESVRRQIIKPITHDDGWYVSRLQVLCKSHKPAGEVSWRNLHCSSQSAFLGLSLWLVGQLQPIVDACPHVVGSVSDFVSSVQCAQLEENDVFVTFDVREFFMSGTPDQLVGAISRCLEPRQGFSGSRGLVIEVLGWLLKHQFITSSQVSGLWRVKEGSGMGLSHSAAVADCAFVGQVDTMVRQPGFKTSLMIKYYWRYKDDLLFVLDRKMVTRLQWYLNKRASPVFRVELSEVNHEELVF